MFNPLVKPLALIALVLVMPLVLLLFWGESFHALAEQWQAAPPAPHLLALAVVGILASDVFLPVPSGPVSTLAGSHLGFVWGTTASAAGMSLGAAIAFGLAKQWGRPLAERFSSPAELAHLESSCRQHGPWMVVLTRPLPVVAEACALLVGALQMRWRAFLPVMLLSNVLVAGAYAALGRQAEEYGWLPLALCASVAVPVFLTWSWHRVRRRAA